MGLLLLLLIREIAPRISNSTGFHFTVQQEQTIIFKGSSRLKAMKFNFLPCYKYLARTYFRGGGGGLLSLKG
jgi:hypothetical protein